MKDGARRLATSLLAEWEKDDKYSNLLLENPRVAALPEEERRFLSALLFGVIENRERLDYTVSSMTGKAAEKLAPNTRRLLEIGFYQLLFMDVPPFAAVNETVKLASNEGERRFLNGVLRAYLRNPEKAALPSKKDDPVRALSLGYSFPAAIVSLFLSQYGDETEELLAALSKRPPLTLRVNTQKTTRDAYLSRLTEGGATAEKTPYSPVGIRVLSPCRPVDLPGFAEGDFFVQDEASQIASLALSPKEGDFVIDTCACPGGKSFSLAMQMKDAGKVLSLDLHESKLSLIESGAKRLGLSSLTAKANDARTPLAAYLGKADAVLCDAPCSGLGVLAKKSDLRHRAAARFEELPPLQKEILSSSSRYVKEGGVLLYSTCTLRKEENEEVAASFLATHPDFAPLDFTVGALSSSGGMLTLFPHKEGCDGFFISKYIRKGTH